jgi:hypothetical protein
MSEVEKVWHPEVINQETARALRELGRTGLLGELYLAGGTGLALRLGHRRSRDLDFFSSGPFDPNRATERLRGLADLQILAKSVGTLHASVAGTKVSFMEYSYPLLFPVEMFQEVSVADPRDIACMKVSAIASRGTRRDFIDLYAVARVHGLKQVVEWFDNKFQEARLSRIHVFKSLTFFDDARQEPMPEMLTAYSWDMIEDFYTSEVPRLI